MISFAAVAVLLENNKAASNAHLESRATAAGSIAPWRQPSKRSATRLTVHSDLGHSTREGSLSRFLNIAGHDAVKEESALQLCWVMSIAWGQVRLG